MSIFRSMINTRNIVLLILVVSLCLLTCFYSVHAGLILSAIGVGLAALTIWQTIEMLTKTKEEKAQETRDEIERITDLRATQWGIYESEDQKASEAQTDMTAKRQAWETVIEEKSTAETRESQTRANYESSARYTQMALDSYMNHTVSCYYCVGSNLCPIGQEAYDSWQSWEDTKKADKASWDQAKTDLGAKITAEYNAYNEWWSAKAKYGSHRSKADNAHDQWTALGTELDRLGTKLSGLEADILLKRAKVEAAKRDFEAAKQTLNELEINYPDEWAEMMSDPSTQYSVEYIRSH